MQDNALNNQSARHEAAQVLMLGIGDEIFAIEASLVRDSATKAQGDFGRGYRGELTRSAQELTGVCAALQGRCARSASFTGQAATRARELSLAVGRAIVSLQGGDSARQRLEHVGAGLELAPHVLAASSEHDDDAQTANLLIRLETAQLGGAAKDLGRDLATISAALNRVGRDTQALVELGRGLIGDDADGASSFLESLQRTLCEAAELTRKCEAARAPVDRVARAVGVMMSEFDETIEALNAIIRDISRIGVNSGLKAARLGAEGRGLIVIAQELKDVARHISDEGKQLAPVVALLQQATKGLDRTQSQGGGQIAAIDATLRTVLDQLRQSNLRLSGGLAELTKDAAEFGAVLGNAQSNILAMELVNETLRDLVQSIGAGVAPGEFATEDQEERVCGRVGDLVSAFYTMAVERDIHRAVLASVNAPPADRQTPDGPMEDLLWSA
ncbi:hypothetical protein [Methylocella silvestris]|uniref:Methyl-accepting transducer domain-containing protein n=1 Tax=Methylocella silvestris TaxID=199596 RepID=A0A2J7TE89_METSI|nr:hypothetical protein [Methylocella silvestris]PNG25063.1 hypothetical protein CR492_15585 [Methylocella silvestris]